MILIGRIKEKLYHVSLMKSRNMTQSTHFFTTHLTHFLSSYIVQNSLDYLSNVAFVISGLLLKYILSVVIVN